MFQKTGIRMVMLLNDMMYQSSSDSFNMLKAFGLGTRIHLAATQKRLDVIRRLLAKGVDTEASPRGSLAIDCAKHNQ